MRQRDAGVSHDNNRPWIYVKVPHSGPVQLREAAPDAGEVGVITKERRRTQIRRIGLQLIPKFHKNTIAYSAFKPRLHLYSPTDPGGKTALPRLALMAIKALGRPAVGRHAGIPMICLATRPGGSGSTPGTRTSALDRGASSFPHYLAAPRWAVPGSDSGGRRALRRGTKLSMRRKEEWKRNCQRG